MTNPQMLCLEHHPACCPSLSDAHVANWRVQWQNDCENLLLIEERMSEFVEFTAAPLQLVRNKRQTEARIADLERRLGIGQ